MTTLKETCILCSYRAGISENLTSSLILRELCGEQKIFPKYSKVPVFMLLWNPHLWMWVAPVTCYKLIEYGKVDKDVISIITQDCNIHICTVYFPYQHSLLLAQEWGSWGLCLANSLQGAKGLDYENNQVSLGKGSSPISLRRDPSPGQALIAALGAILKQGMLLCPEWIPESQELWDKRCVLV